MLWGILFLAGSAFQSLLWKALLSQAFCGAGLLLHGKLPKRRFLSPNLSLPTEACPQLSPLLDRGWCSAWRGFDQAGWKIRLVGGLHAGIGEVFLGLLLLLLKYRCMLCLQKKNPKAKRPKLCYHAKLHGKLPFSEGQAQAWAMQRMQSSSLSLSGWGAEASA